MDNLEPKPVLTREQRFGKWLEATSLILSHIGCWLLISGLASWYALNKATLGWTLYCLGWFIGGLGGSLFINACLLTAKTNEANDSNDHESRHWLWPELRFGFLLILVVVAAPVLAPIAIGLTFFLDMALLILFFIVILVRMKKAIGFRSSD